MESFALKTFCFSSKSTPSTYFTLNFTSIQENSLNFLPRLFHINFRLNIGPLFLCLQPLPGSCFSEDFCLPLFLRHLTFRYILISPLIISPFPCFVDVSFQLIAFELFLVKLFCLFSSLHVFLLWCGWSTKAVTFSSSVCSWTLACVWTWSLILGYFTLKLPL